MAPLVVFECESVTDSDADSTIVGESVGDSDGDGTGVKVLYHVGVPISLMLPSVNESLIERASLRVTLLLERVADHSRVTEVLIVSDGDQLPDEDIVWASESDFFVNVVEFVFVAVASHEPTLRVEVSDLLLPAALSEGENERLSSSLQVLEWLWFQSK